MSAPPSQEVRYRGHPGYSSSAGMQHFQESNAPTNYPSAARNEVNVDNRATGVIMSLFGFLTNFKTHLYASFALRTALILYGDHKVHMTSKTNIKYFIEGLVKHKQLYIIELPVTLIHFIFRIQYPKSNLRMLIIVCLRMPRDTFIGMGVHTTDTLIVIRHCWPGC